MTTGALHEALRELFAARPELVAQLIAPHVDPVVGPVVPLPTEQTDPKMKRLLPDAVLGTPSAKAPRVVFVVEVQLAIKESKRRVWVHYLASAHDRNDCWVELIVITPFAEVARWAAEPIRFGRGNVVTPRVIGPDGVPWVSPEEAKRSPALAVLSTLSHRDDPRSAEQALWTFEALAAPDQDADGRLADMLAGHRKSPMTCPLSSRTCERARFPAHFVGTKRLFRCPAKKPVSPTPCANGWRH